MITYRVFRVVMDPAGYPIRYLVMELDDEQAAQDLLAELSAKSESMGFTYELRVHRLGADERPERSPSRPRGKTAVVEEPAAHGADDELIDDGASP